MKAATQKKESQGHLNGIDVPALQGVIAAVREDHSKGMVEFRVKSEWQGQTRSKTRVESYRLGGQTVKRRFEMTVDEPLELLGENTAANPQEMLMTALNSCIMVGYVVGASVNGIRLDSVEIETVGELDLRGFLGIDDQVAPGYPSISYTVRLKGDGTPEQFQRIHETVCRTSPNYFNMSRPIQLNANLVVES